MFDCGAELRGLMRQREERRVAMLTCPPRTPDEVRAKEIGMLAIFRDTRREDETLQEFLRRHPKWSYYLNPKIFSDAGFEFKVPGKSLSKWAGWLNRNCHGCYSYEEDGMSFELKSDALLFKLTWGGA